MKKILLLGGAMQQIPSIVKAKEMGYYTITCDYLPENPGHKYSDEFYNISTTDKEAVLELAKKLSVDGVVSYASDPAALTAAYISEKMNLPTSPYESVEILTKKDKFRKFLRENNFNVPPACGYNSLEEALSDISRYKFPLMVKPVDSSGSKGVVKINNSDELSAAVEEALSYSKEKRFIIEEFIIKKGYQISGDGFSVNGKLVFASYGNELYSNTGSMREYVALGEFWPVLLDKDIVDKINKELQRLITALNMKSNAYNIEVILDEDDNVYILELGPRNGGSYIPQLIRYATGVDLVEYSIKAAMGEDCSDLKQVESKGFWSNYMILSKQTGLFDGIWFDEKFKRNNLLEVHCSYTEGDKVTAYSNTSHSLGTLLFKCESLEEILEKTEHIHDYFGVNLKNENNSSFLQTDTLQYEIKLSETYNESIHVLRNALSWIDLPFRGEKIEEYIEKVAHNSILLYAYDGSVLGILAVYSNDITTQNAYITQIAVSPKCRRNKIAQKMLDICFYEVQNRKMKTISLEVKNNNIAARSLYDKNGFTFSGKSTDNSIYMIKRL